MSEDRLEKMRKAIRALEARGERPTGRKVVRELGGAVDPVLGIKGEDARLWAQAMTEEGYVREPRGSTVRWVKA